MQGCCYLKVKVTGSKLEREEAKGSGSRGGTGKAAKVFGITCKIQKEEKVKSKIIKIIRNNKNK
jgi:hypothetical protein